MTELTILRPDQVRLFRIAGRLCATLEDDRSWKSVTLARAFPLSDPDHYWGLLDADGKDIGVVADPSGLDAASLAEAREELHRRYFIPVIQKVLHTRDDHGSIIWTVHTDKGERTFTVRNMKDSIIELGGTRLLLVDVDGTRYEIPDMRHLDSKSYDLILRSL